MRLRRLAAAEMVRRRWASRTAVRSPRGVEAGGHAVRSTSTRGRAALGVPAEVPASAADAYQVKSVLRSVAANVKMQV